MGGFGLILVRNATPLAFGKLADAQCFFVQAALTSPAVASSRRLSTPCSLGTKLRNCV
jgi:hypothetical protein